MSNKPNISIIGYTMAQQLEIFHDHELQKGNDIPSAKRVFIQRVDGSLIPLDCTIVVMYGDYE
jgi:hypothetical protein